MIMVLEVLSNLTPKQESTRNLQTKRRSNKRALAPTRKKALSPTKLNQKHQPSHLQYRGWKSEGAEREGKNKS